MLKNLNLFRRVKIKSVVRECYAKADDITFIMYEDYNNEGDVVRSRVVGWYYGEPDALSTATFKNKLVATYK